MRSKEFCWRAALSRCSRQAKSAPLVIALAGRRGIMRYRTDAIKPLRLTWGPSTARSDDTLAGAIRPEDPWAIQISLLECNYSVVTGSHPFWAYGQWSAFAGLSHDAYMKGVGGSRHPARSAQKGRFQSA